MTFVCDAFRLDLWECGVLAITVLQECLKIQVRECWHEQS